MFENDPSQQVDPTQESGWQHFRDHLKDWWTALTDDEIEQLEGNPDQLAGKLQERYGWTKEQTDLEIDRYFHGIGAIR